MATPNFVLAVVLINLFAVQLGWLPVAGSGSWKHIILPTLVLAAEPLGFATRLVRTSYLERIGSYNKKKKVFEDRDLFQRIERDKIFHLPVPLYNYVKHGQSVTDRTKRRSTR